jgi:hypothetical protein
MCIFYIISFMMCLIIHYLSSVNHSYKTGLNKYIQECLYSSDSNLTKLLTSSRGTEYYLISEKYKNTHNKTCLVSIWAFTHIFLYMMIGVYCPNLFFPSLIVGVLFELGEKVFNCHDVLDVIFNSIGFGIGYQINKLFLNKKSFRTSIFYFGLIMLIILLFMIGKIVQYQNNIHV